jgi:hypothetical protein
MTCVAFTSTVGLALFLWLAPRGGLAQTPEQQKLWEVERAQALAEETARQQRLAQERAARKADPMAWVHGLDPLAAGGWEFRAVANDGSWATFSTDHQMKRAGQLVTVWLRREYAEPQGEGGEKYLSNVEKVQYQCTDQRTRALLSIYYPENNLRGSERIEEGDPKQTPWGAIVPGTQDELNSQWACNAARGKHG